MERNDMNEGVSAIADAESSGAVALQDGAASVGPDESIFDLLSARARGHSRGHLALATIIGGVDAAALGWAHPTLWPLATLFAAAGAYGAWGLMDRALTDHAPDRSRPFRPAVAFAVRVTRDMLAIVGVMATVAALAGIWAATIGEWHH